MLLSGLIALVLLMVHTRPTNKLKRAKQAQKPGEFVSIDDSDSEDESIDWEALMEEDSTPTKVKETGKKKSTKVKEKGKKTPTAMEKGKAPLYHSSFKRKGIVKKAKRIHDVDTPQPNLMEDEIVPIGEDRIRAFGHRECIGERHVNLKALRERSSEFGLLVDQIKFTPICQFPEVTGFCLNIVRGFYAYAQHLREEEGGPMQFTTKVRDKKLIITPQLIGQVIGMPASLMGKQFLKGYENNPVNWQRVVEGICMPETRPSGHTVLSKELRPEYRFLNYIVCCNVLPNMQTKVLRWERMAFLYLLGHPAEAQGINMNIPYIIWWRMAKSIDSKRFSERLPFPMIIMRILRKLEVDTSSSSYIYSPGTISDSTIVKSLFTRSSEATPSTSNRREQQQGTKDDASITSILREQQRLARKQEEICEEMEVITASQIVITEKIRSTRKILKKLAANMGCPLSDDSDSD